jgi:hypothetical protein
MSVRGEAVRVRDADTLSPKSLPRRVLRVSNHQKGVGEWYTERRGI